MPDNKEANKEFANNDCTVSKPDLTLRALLNHFRMVGLNGAPVRRLFSISCVRAGHARPFSGVRLSCSDSIIGNGSVGPGIWLSVVHTPAGGEMVSINPMPASTGTLMREAKLTG